MDYKYESSILLNWLTNSSSAHVVFTSNYDNRRLTDSNDASMSTICDVIKQNESELANIVFEI